MSEEQFGTADAYIWAFRALAKEGSIRGNHIALLQAHFNSPAHTTTWAKLAQAVGYAKGGAVHLQYGRLGRRLAHQLGQRPDYWNLILVDWAQHKASGHTAYVLRRPVIEALTRLGIVTESGKSVGAPYPHSIEEAEEDLSKRVTTSLRLAPDQRRLRLSLAEKHPTRIEVITSVFVRNADVVAEVLHRANGRRESCGYSRTFHASI